MKQSLRAGIYWYSIESEAVKVLNVRTSRFLTHITAVDEHGNSENWLDNWASRLGRVSKVGDHQVVQTWRCVVSAE